VLVLILILAKKFHLLRLPVADSCEKISFTAITSCLSCAHAVFDDASAEKMQKAVQRLQRQRDMQVQNSLLYGQMDSEILALNKMIQKIKMINIEV